jgi:hypothetical protein
MSLSDFRVNSGLSLFCSRLSSWSLSSGWRCSYASGIIQTGMDNQRPVMGGESPESRAIYAITPAKFAPEDMPPTMKPLAGEAFKCFSALAATCEDANQYSL